MIYIYVLVYQQNIEICMESVQNSVHIPLLFPAPVDQVLKSKFADNLH